MELGLITKNNIKPFAPLLLPDAALAITHGEPLLAFGAVMDKTAVGAIAGHAKGGLLIIDSFYVSPAFRGYGCGYYLYDAFRKKALEFGLDLEISFLAYTEEHEHLIDYLNLLMFDDVSEDSNSAFAISVEKMFTYPFFSAAKLSGMLHFTGFTELQLKRFSAGIAQTSASIPERGLIAPSIDKEVSVLYVDKGIPKAMLAFEKLADDMIILSGSWNATGKPATFLRMLQESALVIKEKYPPDAKLVMQAVNSNSVALIRKIIPDASRISYTFRKILYKEASL